jgi:hypothetical protein
MKTTISFFAILIFTFLQLNLLAQIGINTSNTAPNTNAMLDVSSTTKGVLFPRMTSAQRIVLGTVATDGLTVYDTDTKGYWFYNGINWVEIVSTTSQPWNNYIEPGTGKKIIYATAGNYNFQGGTITGPLSSGVGTDGSITVFQPGLFNLSNYLNIDGSGIQARQNSNFQGKIEMPLKLNPFGGNIGVGLGATLPTAKFHLAGNMKIDGINSLEFGAGIVGKEINSGKIGYQAFGNLDALDIVGAGGPGAGNRRINLWAEGGTSVKGGLFGVNTSLFNIVPLGIAEYVVSESNNGINSNATFTNISGNLIVSAESSTSIQIDDLLTGKFKLDPNQVSQYSKIVAFGSPSYGGSVDFIYLLTSISGSIDEIYNGINVIPVNNPFGAIPGTYYSVGIRVDDFPLQGTSYLHGTVIFYGIK